MANKRQTKHQDVIRKSGGTAFAIDDSTSDVDEWVDASSATSGAENTALWAFDHLAVDSDGRPRLIVPENTSQQHVGIVLPYGVLIALLDPAHELADAESATGLGLLQDGALTAIGALVIAGTDKTALGHKMAARWRETHNRELDGKKG